MFNFNMELLDTKLDMLEKAEGCFKLGIDSAKTHLGFCLDSKSKA